MLQSDTMLGALRTLLANRCYSAVGLAEGTNAGKIKTTNTATFSINGIFYSKAGTDNLSFSAGMASLAAGFTSLVVVCLDSSGAVSTYQGRPFKSETDVDGTTKYRGYTLETIGEAAGAANRKGGDLEKYNSEHLPAGIPDTVTPIGVLKIANASASAFVFGTTDLSAAGITGTYYDICGVTPAGVNL